MQRLEHLARHRQYQKALDVLSTTSCASVDLYKSYFRGLLNSKSGGIFQPVQSGLDKMRALHGLQLDSESTELVFTSYSFCRDHSSLLTLLASIDTALMNDKTTAIVLDSLASMDRLDHSSLQQAWDFQTEHHCRQLCCLSLCHREKRQMVVQQSL